MNEKRIVQDIVPNNRRTIRNLSITKRAGIKINKIQEEELPKKVPVIDEDIVDEIVNINNGSNKDNPIKETKKRRIIGTLFTFLIIFLGVAIIAAASSLLYLKAVVTVIPKTAEINTNGTFTANRDAKFPDLAYEIITATSSIEQSVLASDGPMIETKASGMVNIYNEQSAQQTLIAGTRLSNSPGIIYRTVSAIVIPKSRTVDGRLVPGSISVKVIADQSGSDYNSRLNDSVLNIVAFKGTTRYSTVYAKMKTDIIGGFKGNKKNVPDDIKKATVDNMKESLKTKLSEEIKSKVLTDRIMFSDAYIIEYDTPEPSRKDAEHAFISTTATIYGIVFKKNVLIKVIADKDINNFPTTEYDIDGLDSISFSIINQKDFSPRIASPLNFIVKGKVKITGKLNQEELKDKLKGIKLNESPSVFRDYPSIDNAYSRITPFWMRSFPNTSKDITIEVKH